MALCPLCCAPTKWDFVPCPDCKSRIFGLEGPCCTLCGRDLLDLENPCPSCRNVQKKPLHFDSLQCLGPWAGALREWVSAYKYGEDSRMASYLAKELAHRIPMKLHGCPLVPVPPRKKRLKKEGFDPVGHLAKGLASYGHPIWPLLRRHGNTAQKTLDRQQRMDGMALQYALRSSRINHVEKVLLLDDVMTTGATLSCCAALLKNSGIKKVHALVLAYDENLLA